MEFQGRTPGKRGERAEGIVWRQNQIFQPTATHSSYIYPQRKSLHTLQEMTSDIQRNPAEGPPKSFRTQLLQKRTQGEVALTCKGHDGMFPQGAELLLTAGFTGDILGAGEVHHQ